MSEWDAFLAGVHNHEFARPGMLTACSEPHPLTHRCLECVTDDEWEALEGDAAGRGAADGGDHDA